MYREVQMNTRLRLGTVVQGAILAGMLMVAVVAVAQVETIDAIARGTSTQMGKDFNIKVSFDRFSTTADKQVLKNAFDAGGHDGLVKALEKMKAVGRLRLPSNTGYSIAYAETIPTATGRKIRFITTRPIAFGESKNMTRSKNYDLTTGEIEIVDQDMSKSTGVMYPMAKLGLNNDGQIQFELYQNPWQLTHITDWKPKAKE
jgi:hypothetical protein